MLLTVFTVQAQSFSKTDFSGASVLPVTTVTDSLGGISYAVQSQDLYLLDYFNPIVISQWTGVGAIRYQKDTQGNVIRKKASPQKIVITHLFSQEQKRFLWIIDIHETIYNGYRHPIIVQPEQQDTLHLYFNQDLKIFDYCNEAVMSTFAGSNFDGDALGHYSRVTSADPVERRINGLVFYKDQEDCKDFLMVSMSHKPLLPLAQVTLDELTFQVTKTNGAYHNRNQKSIVKVSVPEFIKIKSDPVASLNKTTASITSSLKK